jgi:hypothetical protein
LNHGFHQIPLGLLPARKPEKCLNKRQLNTALRTLPKTLDETYERILNSIEGGNAAYALEMLRWLAFAEQPPSLEQVAAVIAIDAADAMTFNEEEVFGDPEDALTVCGSLLTIIYGYAEGPRRRLSLSHFSVKECLTSTRIGDGPAKFYHITERESHESIARACLVYLRALDYSRNHGIKAQNSTLTH